MALGSIRAHGPLLTVRSAKTDNCFLSRIRANHGVSTFMLRTFLRPAATAVGRDHRGLDSSHLFVERRNRHFSDDVVRLGLVAEVDDVALLLVGENRRGSR